MSNRYSVYVPKDASTTNVDEALAREFNIADIGTRKEGKDRIFTFSNLAINGDNVVHIHTGRERTRDQLRTILQPHCGFERPSQFGIMGSKLVSAE